MTPVTKRVAMVGARTKAEALACARTVFEARHILLEARERRTDPDEYLHVLEMSLYQQADALEPTDTAGEKVAMAILEIVLGIMAVIAIAEVTRPYRRRWERKCLQWELDGYVSLSARYGDSSTIRQSIADVERRLRRYGVAPQ